MALNDWIQVAISKASAHEGNASSVNANKDGQGVSWGIIQWTQRGGGLLGVLEAVKKADRAAWTAAWDGRGDAVLELLRGPDRMAPLDGAYLWEEPWVGRFRKLGTYPKVQQAQVRHAGTSEYVVAAIEVAKVLKVATLRSMVLFFDRAIHQGPASAVRVARRLATFYDEAGWPESATRRLAEYGWLCAKPYRLTAAPTTETRDDTSVWRRLDSDTELDTEGKLRPAPGPVWHAVRGSFDLYKIISGRTAEILADTTLTDAGVNLG